MLFKTLDSKFYSYIIEEEILYIKYKEVALMRIEDLNSDNIFIFPYGFRGGFYCPITEKTVFDINKGFNIYITNENNTYFDLTITLNSLNLHIPIGWFYNIEEIYYWIEHPFMVDLPHNKNHISLSHIYKSLSIVAIREASIAKSLNIDMKTYDSVVDNSIENNLAPWDWDIALLQKCTFIIFKYLEEIKFTHLSSYIIAGIELKLGKNKTFLLLMNASPYILQ